MFWSDGDYCPFSPRGGPLAYLTSDECMQLILDEVTATNTERLKGWIFVYGKNAKKDEKPLNKRILEDYGLRIYGHCILAKKKRFYWGYLVQT